MITFRQTGDEAPGAFQALINRQPIGFWIQAETAKEAEERLIELAGGAEEAERVQKDLLFRLGKAEGDNGKLVQECETALAAADEANERHAAENELLEVKVRQLEEVIQQMKTASQKPDKKPLRMFGRRSDW